MLASRRGRDQGRDNNTKIIALMAWGNMRLACYHPLVSLAAGYVLCGVIDITGLNGVPSRREGGMSVANDGWANGGKKLIDVNAAAGALVVYCCLTTLRLTATSPVVRVPLLGWQPLEFYEVDQLYADRGPITYVLLQLKREHSVAMTVGFCALIRLVSAVLSNLFQQDDCMLRAANHASEKHGFPVLRIRF